MRKVWCILSLLLLVSSYVHAKDSVFKCEGILGTPYENINNMNFSAQSFIPYNPVIVEIGAYEGAGTLDLSRSYPYGTIYAFEPHPKAYAVLAERMLSSKNVHTINLAVNTREGFAKLWGDDAGASLLRFEKQKKGIKVPCVILDEWCQRNGVTSIDFLRLDVGGMEWQIFQSSPNIMKTVNAIVIKTHLAPSEKSVVSFRLMRIALEKEGFKLLSHWYEEGKKGEAIFVRKNMYDSIFN